MTVKYDGPDFWMNSCPEMKGRRKGREEHRCIQGFFARALFMISMKCPYVFSLLTPGALSTLFSTLLFS